MNKKKSRDSWGSRLGIIMAVAGSAIGLGNFLRFPAKSASNGGGAFMIPYFVSLFLFFILGMWFVQEWLPIIFMKNVSIGNRIYILGTRLGLVSIFLILAVLVRIAWKRKRIAVERLR